MKYSIDTDVLIEAWRYYPIDVFPSVWKNLEELAINNVAGISDIILGELEIGGDELYNWAKSRESDIVVQTTEAIEQEVVHLVNEYNNFGIITGKNEADPWVVAVAKVYNCSVVTNEGASGNMNGPKIPDVCNAEGLNCIKLLDIIRNEGFQF